MTVLYEDNHLIIVNKSVSEIVQGDKTGDTSKTDQMAQMAKLGIDYAFLPIDGIYNMGPAEMMRCAKLIDAKRVIPYHMDPGHLFNEADAEKVRLPNVLIVPAGGVIDY